MFELTDGQLAKLACAALVGVLAVIAALLDRLLTKVSRATLAKTFWSLLGSTFAFGLLAGMMGPKHKAAPSTQMIMDGVAVLMLVCFLAAITVGLIARRRAA